MKTLYLIRRLIILEILIFSLYEFLCFLSNCVSEATFIKAFVIPLCAQFRFITNEDHLVDVKLQVFLARDRDSGFHVDCHFNLSTGVCHYCCVRLLPQQQFISLSVTSILRLVGC